MFESIVGIVERAGHLGIALLMFVENVFPPIPSELIMPLAGFVAARGELSLFGVVLAGSVGSLAGALFWYGIGRWLGADRIRHLAARHGRWLTLSPAEFDSAQAFFARHAGLAVLLGRLVPGVRTLISVPAGVVAMPLSAFLLWSSLGTLAWTGALAAGGYLLESQYERVSALIDPVSKAMLAALVGVYLWRVWRFRPEPAGLPEDRA